MIHRTFKYLNGVQEEIGEIANCSSLQNADHATAAAAYLFTIRRDADAAFYVSMANRFLRKAKGSL